MSFCPINHPRGLINFKIDCH
ncbi:hypothetical protein CY0110_19847 [Crocosphaera chwakensis CCY0110]|uniref:Uncharacterized protein n=1 Tax=Crocosphaera chwakensis CCY0110 TaxID=391612 RepID=A3IJV1_9CHRO|nr:hypothetical protein CY0110_19847 [Crocosphaera chwakensis CCY0110]